MSHEKELETNPLKQLIRNTVETYMEGFLHGAVTIIDKQPQTINGYETRINELKSLLREVVRSEEILNDPLFPIYKERLFAKIREEIGEK
jgi:hypothetical protein